MIELRRERAAAGPVVQGIAPAGFKVDGRIIAGGLLLTPERADALEIQNIVELDAGALIERCAMQPAPEFLLLGSGPTMEQPPLSFRKALDDRGIGLEVMDSRAAARTWGVLRAEHRWVAAALFSLN